MLKDIKNMLVWSEISKALTDNSNPNNIRKDKIPKKHQEKVNQLIKYIHSWLKDEPLYKKDEAFTLVREEISDLKAEIDDLYNRMYKSK